MPFKPEGLPHSVYASDLRLMLLCTFRYSLGRQTYMPSESRRYIKTYGPYVLSSQDYRQIAEEIDDHVRIYGGEHGLGSEHDAAGWRAFQEWCLERAGPPENDR